MCVFRETPKEGKLTMKKANIEIEKKWKLASKKIRQGYIVEEKWEHFETKSGIEIPKEASEVRLRQKGDRFYLTFKGDGGLTRFENEEEISKDKFDSLWPLTEGKRVEKIRAEIKLGGKVLEVDVFTDRDLVLAEIEFDSEEAANNFPDIGEDVTADKKFKNKNLAK